jgi:alkanesulfonate monooxygenase SsuD/methylene tetrahydromethanopterin reductase-like flavin-dependent oxidoreductase (luciferase family)
MKIGFYFPSFWGSQASPCASLGAAAEEAEAVGFSSLWAADHFYLPPADLEAAGMAGQSGREVPELWTLLAFCAARTRRIKLGSLVSSVTFRSPGVLFAIVNTLDALSGGRVILGLGAGDLEEEHRRLGIPYPGARDRFDMLEETLRILLQGWGGEDRPFHGDHYQMASTATGATMAVENPHPPILVGGRGEKRTMTLAARYADIYNTGVVGSPAPLARKLDVLRERCEREQRSFASISRTVVDFASISPAEGNRCLTPNQYRERLRTFAQLGVEEVIVMQLGEVNPWFFEVFRTELIPTAAELLVLAGSG